MKKLIIILLLMTSTALSQTDNIGSTGKTGFEFDALPYLSGGNYFSAWRGSDNIRLRGVFANVKSPSIIIPDGYEDHKIEAYALLLDYFPFSEKEEFEKWWFGAGLEYWKNSIRNSSDKTADKYNNVVFTSGFGYIWKFRGNFYLNPWAAGHLSLSGNGERQIGNRNFKPKRFLYEASLKIGFCFK